MIQGIKEPFDVQLKHPVVPETPFFPDIPQARLSLLCQGDTHTSSRETVSRRCLQAGS
jgi:hypothetical protein